MAEITLLPVELLLLCFSNFSLKSLIAASGVCQRWRELIPFADIWTPRRALFELYMDILSSPFFRKTRPRLLKVKDFDREAFLAALLDQHDYIPEDFRVWILEWPARAFYACFWPGLASVKTTDDVAADFQMIEWVNWLGSLPPKVSTMIWTKGRERIPVPGMLIWAAGSFYTWLVLDEREELRNKVYEMKNTHQIWTLEFSNIATIHKNWVAFLRDRWKWIGYLVTYREKFPILHHYRSVFLGGSPILPESPAAPWIKNRQSQS